jgi:ATP-binding cassette subfamily C protein
MVMLLILAGTAEGIGLVTLLPLLELALQDGASGGKSALARVFSETLLRFEVEPSVGALLAIIVVGIFLKAGFLWLAMRQAGYTVAHVGNDLRLKLIRALLRARWEYFTSQPSGQFANAIASEAYRSSQAYRLACDSLAALIQVVFYLAVALLVSWQVALLALLAGSAIVLLLGRFIRVSRRSGRIQTQLMQSLVVRLTDALRGIKPIKAMAREEHLSPLLQRETQGIADAQVRHVLARETLRASQEPLLAIMLAVGLYIVLKISNQPFSSLLVMAFLFHRLVGRVNRIQNAYQQMTVGESAFWSLRQSIEVAEREREDSRGRIQPTALREGVRLEAVDFSYGEGNVLRDVSLSVPAGKFIALVGPSGAGKTTIVDLIIGLLRPHKGEIYVDGIPMRELELVAWRQIIGYVPQEMFLFHDSVYQNVTLGDPLIIRADVEAALVKADAWDFVSQLRNGMDTVIGEAGAKLSGGQRQRVAIARALVRKPTLLVLDEVTTALDPKTEAAVMATLTRLRGTVTIVTISHQAALVEVADIVYRCDGGRVWEVRDMQPARGVGEASKP